MYGTKGWDNTWRFFRIEATFDYGSALAGASER